MAATLVTQFWNHDASTWDSPAKIVFTSPNIDDLSAAGTRSHVLPELMDIALWYESVSTMYRKTISQTTPDNIMFQRYGELHTSYIFGTSITMDLYDSTGPVSDWQPSGQVRHISANSMTYSSVSDLGSGHFQFTHSADSGTNTAVSGTKIFLAQNYCDVPLTDCIMYEMTLGEAYNAYLTAWDDDTHTTTDNPVISGSHYRAAVSVFYLTGTKQDPYSAEGTTYGTLVGTPDEDVILYGNTSKYTVSGTLRYNAIDPSVTGAILAFRPMLYGMASAGLPFGSYDFITTLHFQYT
jgi:hypothetical protein